MADQTRLQAKTGQCTWVWISEKWDISLSHLTKKFEFLNGRIGKLGAAIGMKGNVFVFLISFVVLLVFRLVVLIKSLGKRLKIGL